MKTFQNSIRKMATGRSTVLLALGLWSSQAQPAEVQTDGLSILTSRPTMQLAFSKPPAPAQSLDWRSTQAERRPPAQREEQMVALMNPTALPDSAPEHSIGLGASSHQTRTDHFGPFGFPTDLSEQTMDRIAREQTAEERFIATPGVRYSLLETRSSEGERGWKFGAPRGPALNYRPEAARLIADPSLGQSRGLTLFHLGF